MRKINQLLFLWIALLLIDCKGPEDVRLNESSDLAAPQTFGEIMPKLGFRFENGQASGISITVQDNQGKAMEGIPLYLYSALPEQGGALMASGETNALGKLDLMYQYSALSNRPWLYTPYIGLPQWTELQPDPSGAASILLGGLPESSSRSGLRLSNSPGMLHGFKTFGSWTQMGLPSYLTGTRDVIDQPFLDDINLSLPERRPVPSFNPQYLASGNDIDVKLVQSADVWVTFIHEGAGHLNVLGYYTYPLANPPASRQQIDTLRLIFPNVSFLNSGGSLRSGDKVYLGNFPPNTGIGWFIIANGFSTATGTLRQPIQQIFYSNPNFNPESTPAKRQHNVLLVDQARKKVILGFEDLNRDGTSDDDFNDAIFMVTTNPISALQYGNIQPISFGGRTDTDQDGVPDNQDAYPTDGRAAFDNYTPSEQGFGSLAFEDLWPAQGDYDFNDLVVDYRFHYISNADNEVIRIHADFKVKAIGASFRNGFGFVLPVSPTLISSISGQRLSRNLINLNANGTEQGQQQATIMVFDDAFEVLPRISGGLGVNTLPNEPYRQPDSIRITMQFGNPVPVASLGLPPYNPFIFVNGERGKEVHLPGYAPTTLANPAYFGTLKDHTSPTMNRFYQTKTGLPFALHMPNSFDYPSEKNDLMQTYPKIAPWVTSGGQQYYDWFMDKPGYRNPAKIYKK
jgi:LruC domain-containing protein